MPVGYIVGLQPPQPGFSRDGVQWHDANSVQSRWLHQLYAEKQEVECAPEMASYAYYASSVAPGSLSWGEHLRMVTFRHGLETAFRFSVRSVVAQSRWLIFRTTVNTTGCGPLFCTHK